MTNLTFLSKAYCKTIVILFSLAFFTVQLKSYPQTIDQIGYYYKNGISAIDSKTGIMVAGLGETIDITNPFQPLLMGQTNLAGFGASILVDGNFAYFGTGMSAYFKVVDITNPYSPTVIASLGFLDISNGIFGMDKRDTLMLLALGGPGDICSVSVADNNNPFVLNYIELGEGQSRDVLIRDNYAYVAHYEGMKILEINDSGTLSLISSIGEGLYMTIEIHDNTAFLGKLSGGVDVFNIADVYNPTYSYSIADDGGVAWDLKFKDDFLYLAKDNGLFMYQVTDTSAIEHATFGNEGNGQSFAVCLQDSLILLPGLINGIAILQYDSNGVVNVPSEIQTGNLEVFPNPSDGKFVLHYNYPDLAVSNFEVWNMFGQCVFTNDIKGEMNTGSSTLDLSKLPRGAYVLQIKGQGIYFTSKIIIQ